MNASIERSPTPDAETIRAREPTLEETVNTKLIESGEKERLKELLRERLVECGWRDEMKALCREFARKKGRDSVTLDDLIDVITPKGRGWFLVYDFLLIFILHVFVLLLAIFFTVFSSNSQLVYMLHMGVNLRPLSMNMSTKCICRQDGC